MATVQEVPQRSNWFIKASVFCVVAYGITAIWFDQTFRKKTELELHEPGWIAIILVAPLSALAAGWEWVKKKLS